MRPAHAGRHGPARAQARSRAAPRERRGLDGAGPGSGPAPGPGPGPSAAMENMQLPGRGSRTGHGAEESRAPSLRDTQRERLRGHSGFSRDELGQSSLSASADTQQVESQLQSALCAGL
ncbi:uncharacterized protein LOC134558763 isoform X4 [Prinia subflava]|uniref:uncharacterized protein LOC134558763 isoform X4 n=1 Tax=Prinia subflava TaxID=208062 RepID=UPI002FE269D3